MHLYPTASSYWPGYDKGSLKTEHIITVEIIYKQCLQFKNSKAASYQGRLFVHPFGLTGNRISGQGASPHLQHNITKEHQE